MPNEVRVQHGAKADQVVRIRPDFLVGREDEEFVQLTIQVRGKAMSALLTNDEAVTVAAMLMLGADRTEDVQGGER